MRAIDRYIAALILTLYGCLVQAALPANTQETDQTTATTVYEAIRQQFESHLFSLPPRVQGHYGIRLYRMTGDETYANAALVDLLAITESQAFYACQLDKPGFIKQSADMAIEALGEGPRAKARQQALKAFPEFLFYTDILLRFASRIDEFGLQGPCHLKLLAALRGTDLTPGLTDPQMIETWAAQLANYVYWAKQLDVGDYLSEYQRAFARVYPAERDKTLSKEQFRNKLYGMTHFIFAASGYYQQKVNSNEVGWILNYFAANIDRILTDATDDIIAEVGLSFLLAGQTDHTVVAQSRAHIINAFDPGLNIIPSPTGSADMEQGEHRNVLAMMLLHWPDNLHPGPYLAQLDSTRKNLPKFVSSKASNLKKPESEPPN